MQAVTIERLSAIWDQIVGMTASRVGSGDGDEKSDASESWEAITKPGTLERQMVRMRDVLTVYHAAHAYRGGIV